MLTKTKTALRFHGTVKGQDTADRIHFDAIAKAAKFVGKRHQPPSVDPYRHKASPLSDEEKGLLGHTFTDRYTGKRGQVWSLGHDNGVWMLVFNEEKGVNELHFAYVRALRGQEYLR